MKVNLALTSQTQTGDNVTRTFTDFNPAASDTALINFAQGVFELSNNALTAIEKIQITNIAIPAPVDISPCLANIFSGNVQVETTSDVENYYDDIFNDGAQVETTSDVEEYLSGIFN